MFKRQMIGALLVLLGLGWLTAGCGGESKDGDLTVSDVAAIADQAAPPDTNTAADTHTVADISTVKDTVQSVDTDQPKDTSEPNDLLSLDTESLPDLHAATCKLGTGFPQLTLINPDNPDYAGDGYTKAQVKTLFADGKAKKSTAYLAYLAAYENADYISCPFCDCGCQAAGHLSAVDCFKTMHGFT